MAIPFLIITMILVPYLINNVEIKENEISFKTENIKLLDDNKLEIYDVILVGLEGDISSEEIINVLNNNSKYEIIFCIEFGLVFLLVDLIVMIIILSYVEKLFNNIKNNNTPFTLNNVNYIKKISYLMISLILISPLTNILFSSILSLSENSGVFNLMSILEILIIFSMSYVFEYGYEIQKDSKGKMYSE